MFCLHRYTLTQSLSSLVIIPKITRYTEETLHITSKIVFGDYFLALLLSLYHWQCLMQIQIRHKLVYFSIIRSLEMLLFHSTLDTIRYSNLYTQIYQTLPNQIIYLTYVHSMTIKKSLGTITGVRILYECCHLSIFSKFSWSCLLEGFKLNLLKCRYMSTNTAGWFHFP